MLTLSLTFCTREGSAITPSAIADIPEHIYKIILRVFIKIVIVFFNPLHVEEQLIVARDPSVRSL